MSSLPDYIVYIWLFPVVAQLILPLGVMASWLILKPVYRLFSREHTAVAVMHAQKSS